MTTLTGINSIIRALRLSRSDEMLGKASVRTVAERIADEVEKYDGHFDRDRFISAVVEDN